jgi:hypothetical protein
MRKRWFPYLSSLERRCRTSGITPVFLLAVAIPCAASPNQPLDRPFSLRNPEPLLVEGEFHRMIASDRNRTYILPRPCFSMVDSSTVCASGTRLRLAGPESEHGLGLSPSMAYEVRAGEERVQAFEAGAVLLGSLDRVSFLLDARTFTEVHEDSRAPSFDREPVEWQSEEVSGSFAYSSYSRYRSNLNYDWSWGRISAGRDAAHWGPGLYSNLMFNRNAVPFNQITLSARFGPVNVQSLYGMLATEEERIFNTDPHGRSIYAHRYEWNIGRDLILGIGEQLIVYDHEEPFAFVPIIPLFILKGDTWERLNNGNISADFSWRIRKVAALYSEFLIDDIQAPTALFSDDWGNKWAWTAGAHLTRDFPDFSSGTVLEYSRVEPWVYTHYVAASAQSANLGYPLGNPQGPNSQSITAAAYLRGKSAWHLSVRSDLVWKGHDAGSSLLDLPPRDLERKSFLKGVDGPDLALSSSASMRWNYAGIELRAAYDGSAEFAGRLNFKY